MPGISTLRPSLRNHGLTAVPTADLNSVNRFEFSVRSSSIRSRNRESRSGPSWTSESTTDATGASNASTGDSTSASDNSRSATCWVRRPAQILRSVVTGVAL